MLNINTNFNHNDDSDGDENDQHDDPEQILRKLNNVDFKLQMQQQQCIQRLSQTTTKAMHIIQNQAKFDQTKADLSNIKEELNQVQPV